MGAGRGGFKGEGFVRSYTYCNNTNSLQLSSRFYCSHYILKDKLYVDRRTH